MIDRNELAEELLLRENIRKAIKVVLNKREDMKLQKLNEEQELRTVIRDILKEGQAAVAATSRHDSTGINALEDLLRNTNVLFVIETGYKSLTTRTKDDPAKGRTKQRMSYENHILSAVQKSLAPEESRKEAGEDVEITEDVDIEIDGRPEDDPDFINVEDDEVEEEVEVDEKEEFGLDGEDKTGRNRAFTDFTKIEKDILTAFDDLDNPEDMTLFEEYLIKNLALYFDKYEGELASDAAPPVAAGEAAPGVDTGESEEEESEIPAFALHEVMKHLNLDDIIENLL